MRLMYMGVDNRVRVAEANRVKFLEDGFQRTDKMDERSDDITGPVIVAHVYRSKGGKRLTLSPPAGYDMSAARQQLLEKGWLDITDCTVKMENLY
ncbi:hypothetical protein LJC49_00025 [Ruminococcaceae bacterium OttesenSCG-928-I18]|nr:hypothetical protein [Ruminococcaceae bacterium OttesenSCG-928-I18]